MHIICDFIGCNILSRTFFPSNDWKIELLRFSAEEMLYQTTFYLSKFDLVYMLKKLHKYLIWTSDFSITLNMCYFIVFEQSCNTTGQTADRIAFCFHHGVQVESDFSTFNPAICKLFLCDMVVMGIVQQRFRRYTTNI